MRLVLLFGIIPFLSCKTTLNKPSENIHMISFGSYGGISSAGFEYQLNKDGLLQKFSLPKKELIDSIDINRELTNQIFENYKFLKLNSLLLFETGNRTNFIQMKNSDGEHMLRWPVGKLDLTQEVKIYFKLLNQLANKYKF